MKKVIIHLAVLCNIVTAGESGYGVNIEYDLGIIGITYKHKWDNKNVTQAAVGIRNRESIGYNDVYSYFPLSIGHCYFLVNGETYGICLEGAINLNFTIAKPFKTERPINYEPYENDEALVNNNLHCHGFIWLGNKFDVNKGVKFKISIGYNIFSTSRLITKSKKIPTVNHGIFDGIDGLDKIRIKMEIFKYNVRN